MRISGFARAIEDIPFGLYNTVNSEGPDKWAEAFQGVRDRHTVVLRVNKMLKEHYSKEYCWKTQRKELVERLGKMVYGIFYCMNIGFILVLKPKGRCRFSSR